MRGAAERRLASAVVGAAGTAMIALALFGPWWTFATYAREDPQRRYTTDVGLMGTESRSEPGDPTILPTRYDYWGETTLGTICLAARILGATATVLAFVYVVLEASRPAAAGFRRTLPKLPGASALVVWGQLVLAAALLPYGAYYDIGGIWGPHPFWGMDTSDPERILAWGAGWGWYLALAGSSALMSIFLLRRRWSRETSTIIAA